MIPQCNPHAGYLAHKQAIDAAIARVLDSGWYILGKEVESFENEFAAWCGVKHAVGVANGTDAIELALKAAGIQVGDQVATVSHTAVATVAAIRRCGAMPLFIDIEQDYFTMDPVSLEAGIAAATNIKAVVVVHLYGQMADMPAILEIAGQHDLVVIEDCAQAHGATLNGKKAGSWGDFACFSFYPTKNLGALGDGGAVVTNAHEVAEHLQALRQYGWDGGRISQADGVNSRLDELQAAVLRVRLHGLDEDNRKRQGIAKIYRGGLETVESVILPRLRVGYEQVYHQFVVRVKKRGEIQKAMAKAGIATAIHYVQAAHLHPAYCAEQFSPVALENTESVLPDILSLPMFPELSLDIAEQVTDTIQRIMP